MTADTWKRLDDPSAVMMVSPHEQRSFSLHVQLALDARGDELVDLGHLAVAEPGEVATAGIPA